MNMGMEARKIKMPKMAILTLDVDDGEKLAVWPHDVCLRENKSDSIDDYVHVAFVNGNNYFALRHTFEEAVEILETAQNIGSMPSDPSEV